MSSFDRPAAIYLFDLVDGRKKLAYGTSPEDALEVLAMRLTPDEMSRVVSDRWIKIHQRDLARYRELLG